MIIELPIFRNNKKMNDFFSISKDNNNIILNSINNDNIINAMIFNKLGIFNKVIMLPLIFKIKDNTLLSIYFFFNSKVKRLKYDFFEILLNEINKKFNLKLNYDFNVNLDNINYIYENIKQVEINNYNNINHYLNYFHSKIEYFINFILLIIQYNNDNNIKYLLSKKILLLKKNILNIKIFYNGKNKLLLDILNKNNIYSILFLKNEYTIKKLICNKIFKNNHNIELLDYIYNNNKDKIIYLKLLDLINNTSNIEDEYKYIFEDNIEITNDNISFELFRKLIEKENKFNKKILNNLVKNFNNCIYKYSKNKLNLSIEKLLFYQIKFKNHDEILKLISKYYNKKHLINYFNKLINNDKTIFNDLNIYSNKTNYNIINIILFNLPWNNYTSNDMIICFKKNYLLYNLTINLNWMYVKYQIDYIKFYLKFNNKNTFIFNVDNKLKSILLQPYNMFTYLNDEVSFVKWIYIMEDYVNTIFYQPIKIKKEDYYNLGMLLFLINNAKIQEHNDIDYCKLLSFSFEYNDYIIYNNKINIRINEIFNNNINLGKLIKDIKSNCNIISLDIDCNNHIDQINKYKIKYLKYKGKYLFKNLLY